MHADTLSWSFELVQGKPLTERVVFKLRAVLISLEHATDKGELLALFYSLMPDGGYPISQLWCEKVLTKLSCARDEVELLTELSRCTLIGLKSIEHSWYVIPMFRVTLNSGAVIEATVDRERVKVFAANGAVSDPQINH